VAITVSVEWDEKADQLLAVYYQISAGKAVRTIELDKNCLLDIDDVNRVIGLELVGPFSLARARKRASMFTCPELEAIFALLAQEPQLVNA